VGEERRNPIDDWVTFPESVLVTRQDVLPSESIGWGLNLVLAMPPRMTFEHVRAQLMTAGFKEEAAGGSPALFRLVRDDAYVWGMVQATARGSHLFLSTTEPDGDGLGAPDAAER
jgi:hypothetical protein